MRKLHTLLFALLIATGFPAFADATWIDVRTVEEHAEDQIAGDPWIPHEEILTGITEIVSDKDAEIHLYCRSGRRAGIARAALEKAGYTHVSNAGGIDDARQARGLAPAE